MHGRTDEKQNQSWTEWSCDLDEEDASEHILSSRKKEDTAYCFAKEKERTDLFFFCDFSHTINVSRKGDKRW